MSPGYRRKKDTTHNQIVADLRARGFVVFDVAGVPSLGFDIVVFSPGARLFKLFEIKSDKRISHQADAKRLTASELRAVQLAPIPTVTCADDVVRYF